MRYSTLWLAVALSLPFWIGAALLVRWIIIVLSN